MTSGMTILSKLFGTRTKVKVLRLFLFHPDSTLAVSEVARKTKAKRSSVQSALGLLEKVGFLTQTKKKKKTKKGKRGREVKAWSLNKDFFYLSPLRDLLMAVPVDHKRIVKDLKKIGDIHLIVISGVFIGKRDARVDLLVVGNKIKTDKLTEEVKTLESEVGTEITYASLTPSEYEYRKSVNDRLVRDIFDYEHQILFSKIEE